MLWYNSNGVANDAPQGPRGIMDNIVTRKKEMAWMKSIGIKGIKVDFFGGDKQHTMQRLWHSGYLPWLHPAKRLGAHVS